MFPTSEGLRPLLDDTSFQFETTVNLQENLFRLALITCRLVSSEAIRQEALTGPINQKKLGVSRIYKGRQNNELVPDFLVTNIYIQASETSVTALLKATHNLVFSTVTEGVDNPEQTPTVKASSKHNENTELLQHLSSEVTLIAQEIVPEQSMIIGTMKPLYHLQFWVNAAEAEFLL